MAGRKKEYIMPSTLSGRTVVLDFETTGLSPKDGHRAVSLSMIELVDGKPSGKEMDLFFNPHRPVPSYATKVHGLDDAFLKQQPSFRSQAEDISKFIGKNATLVAHNAKFDMKFMKDEFRRAGVKMPATKGVVDTLQLARDLYGRKKGQATLDAVLDNLKIDRSKRDADGHGAKIDTQLLADAYKPLVETHWKQFGKPQNKERMRLAATFLASRNSGKSI
jgi:DNA polymerase-3 subunit epsilon